MKEVRWEKVIGSGIVLGVMISELYLLLVIVAKLTA